MNRSMFIVALSVIGLAVIGLGSRLITDPSGLLTSILIFAAIGVVIWLIFTKASAPSNQSKYKKAVKQSKKYQESKATSKATNKAKPAARSGKVMDYSIGRSRTQTNKTTSRRKKSDVHLTVIEGKKGKKKNQA